MWRRHQRLVAGRSCGGTSCQPIHAGLYAPEVIVRDGIGSWRGIEHWSAEEREAIDVGVRAKVTGLVASGDLTVLEVDFCNPPSAAGHCPPSSTFVHHLVNRRTARLDICYHRAQRG
jgi:hypothetical protein